MTFTDYDQARKAHNLSGGFLLDLGADERGRRVYAVTDEPEDYGRSQENIALLNERNNWDETRKGAA